MDHAVMVIKENWRAIKELKEQLKWNIIAAFQKKLFFDIPRMYDILSVFS